MSLSHFDDQGRAHMVDVSDKAVTDRTAVAEGVVRMTPETLALVTEGRAKKGDVLGVARLAGIMAAKRTADLIPLCHPLALTRVTLDLVAEPDLPGVRVTATVKTSGQTGVEMEALTAVSVACLTVYDMLKAVQKSHADRRHPAPLQGRRQVRALRGPRSPRTVMLTVDQALERCLALVTPLPREPVALRHAHGRMMPAPATARRDQPPFAASAMDGYAVAGDPAAGATFTVTGEAGAGHAFDGFVAPGQAVRIFTGAPVPAGATRVIIQEDVTREGDRITVNPGADTATTHPPAGTGFPRRRHLAAAPPVRP